MAKKGIVRRGNRLVNISDKLKSEIVRRSGIDPRKIYMCVIPVKSDRKEAGDGADK